MYRYVKGKLNGVIVDATWEDGAIEGDQEFIRKIYEAAWKTPWLTVPFPNGIIETEITNPRCFIPLARLVLDEVVEAKTDELFTPGTIY